MTTPNRHPAEQYHSSFEPRYDMSPKDARKLCREFIAQQDAQCFTNKFSCSVVSSEDPFSNLGRFVESSVFNETFHNSPGLMYQEYSPYDPYSTFFTVTDNEVGIPVGVMRIIEDPEGKLKSFDDLDVLDLGFNKQDVYDGYGVDPSRCVDISTLAVLADYRGSKTGYLPSLLTYRTLYTEILSNPKYDHVVAIIDKQAERGLNTLKFPFEPIFGSGYFSYLDSGESRALIAKNTMFYPQLTYWTGRLRQEASETAAEEQNSMNAMIATTIDALINPGYLEPMINNSNPPNDNTSTILTS